MHDLTGKLLLTQSLENAPENNISITSLSKGIYMVTVETTNGTSHTSKLMVE
jgi:Secretion system C-terminal sorting domain